MAPMQFDYIIVGGGSAGSALAARLSADPTTRVLVLEAGRLGLPLGPVHPHARRPDVPDRVAVLRLEVLVRARAHLNGRRIYHARGKVLGGSSSINGMIFQRGNPLDYERWAADPGMSSWSYAHCLPYFKRMENCLAAPGHAGRAVPRHRRAAGTGARAGHQPAVRRVLRGGAAGRVPADVRCERVPAGRVRRVRQEHLRGRRLSAARAYLHPAMSRPNLRVVTWAHTTRILFNGTRATGVEFVLRGDAGVAQVSSAPRRAYGGEVIVCAGAFGSPQLLQLSGVGNASELAALGIPVVADLPGVGENLQDHLEVYVQYGSKLPVSVAPALKWRKRPGVALRWALSRSGPGATNHFEAGGFVRSNDTVRYPNLMFHFLPIAVRYDGSAPAGGHGYQVHIGPMYSDSRGTVKLTLDSPFDKPALRFNYLSTPTDRAEWTEAIAIARRILSQPAFDEFNAGELSPGPSVVRGEGGPRLGGAGRGDGAAPVLHVRDGDRAAVGDRSAVPGGARGVGTAGGRRVRHAVCHQRQHLCAHDDDRGEGGRPDHGKCAAGTGGNSLLPPRVGHGSSTNRGL